MNPPKIPDFHVPQRPVIPFGEESRPTRQLKNYLFLCIAIADGHEFAHSVSGFDQSEAEYIHKYNYPDHEVVRVMVT